MAFGRSPAAMAATPGSTSNWLVELHYAAATDEWVISEQADGRVAVLGLDHRPAHEWPGRSPVVDSVAGDCGCGPDRCTHVCQRCPGLGGPLGEGSPGLGY